jgi:hypothetical protein
MAVSTANFTQFGDATYVFGLDSTATTFASSIGCALESITITGTPEFEAMAKNTQGATAAYVRSTGDKFEFTASGYLVDEALFDAATNFSYAGHAFFINKREKAGGNTDFRKCTIGGVSFPLITSSTPV